MGKVCKRCNIYKDITEYYKYSKMADGYLNICISCIIKSTKDYRNKNIKKIQEYDRQRGRTESSKKRRLEYITRLKEKEPERYREMRKKATTKSRKKYNEKYTAWLKVCIALKNGTITKPQFYEICGNAKELEAHHADYSKPLNVQWLCDSCHKKTHVEIRNSQRKGA